MADLQVRPISGFGLNDAVSRKGVPFKSRKFKVIT